MNNQKNNFEIHSEWLNCKTSQEKLIAFLSDIAHLESILPKDKIQNFQIIDSHKINFSIENIITLTLHISANSDENHLKTIQYISEPFGDYHLMLKAQFQNNQSQIILTGHLNPFILSIAGKKLNNLVKKINTKLSELILP